MINETSQIFKGFGRILEDNHSSTFKGGESWEYGYDILLNKFKYIWENLWGFYEDMYFVILENWLYLVERRVDLHLWSTYPLLNELYV